MLEYFNLTDKRKSKARELSGGMKRRVQIAKAFIHDPPLIILDEPTAGVDIELRYQLWDFLKEQNKNGKTIEENLKDIKLDTSSSLLTSNT